MELDTQPPVARQPRCLSLRRCFLPLRQRCALRIGAVAAAAACAAAAPVPLAVPPAPPLDGALSANLAWMASSRAPPLGANTAAVITCGNVDPVMLPIAANGYRTDFSFAMASSWQASSRTSYCTALLANGCLVDTEERWFRMTSARSAPYVCVPAGLGSRFVSVLRGPGFFGGVTDLGIIVLFGLGASWNKCGFMQGPYTAMAAAQRHIGTHADHLRTVTLPIGTDLCALDSAGVLHCWETLPDTWAAAATAWVPGPGETTRPAGLCMNMTGNTTFLKPSPRLCPQLAAAAAVQPNASTAAGCVAPQLLSSFSLSPCRTSGIVYGDGDVGPSVVVGVRTDGLPLAWIMGADFWDAPPPVNSTGVGPLGLFAASGNRVRVDPRLPPVWRCSDPEGGRMFAGRAADGSGYWEEPEVREQGRIRLALTPPRRNLNASAVALLPKPSLLAYQGGEATPTVYSAACGPFAPFATALATVYDETVSMRFTAGAGGGIRAADGSLELPGHDLSHLLPASPLQVSAMVMPSSLDFVCISFAPAAPPAVVAEGITLQQTWQVKCAGPPRLSPVISSFQDGVSILAESPSYQIDSSSRCMATAPSAVAVSRNTLAVAVSAFVDTATGRVCTDPGCIMFYGYAPLNGEYDKTRFTDLVPRGAPPTATQIKNAEAIALHPGSGGFVCALVRASTGQPLGLYCGAGTASIPATSVDRPPSDGSISLHLLAATNTTVCTTLRGTGNLWCFADSITPLAASASALFTMSVPAGADAARAVLIDANVTLLASSESIFCFLHAVGAGLNSALACVGPGSDPLLMATISVATTAGYSASTLALWAGSRGGTVATASLLSVAVGNSHACVLDSGMRLWCWGTAASAAAVADVNADNGRYIRVAAGGASTCAVRVDGRIRCFGGILDSYIQNGQRSTWALTNASQAASAAAEPLLPVVLAGLSISVSNFSGNDAACDFAPAGAAWDVPPLPVAAGGPVPCATLSGAFAAVARRSVNSSDTVSAYSIWVNGSVSATPPSVRTTNASTLALPVTVGLLRVAGIADTSATVAFADCLSAAAAPTACLRAHTLTVPGLVIESLVLRPARAATSSSPVHCSSVIESLVATRLVSVALVGWNCTGALVAFSTSLSAADNAFAVLAAQAAGGSVLKANTPVGAGITSEVAGLAVYDSRASAAVFARAMPAVRVAAVTAQGCTLEAVVLVDQALYARVDGVVVDAHAFAAGANGTAATSAAVQELLPGVVPCGVAVRMNRVSMCEVSGVSVSAGSIRLLSAASSTAPVTGGAVCLSEIVHSAATPSAPAVQAAILSDIRVDDCIIDCGDGGKCGGCAVWAALPLSSDARISITGVQASRAAVSGDGAVVYLQVPSAQLSNISCVDTFAGGRTGGGCIAVDDSNSVSVSDVAATRTVATQGGGAVFLRTATGDVAASVANSAFSSNLALGSDGGAVQVLTSSIVALTSILCDKSAAPVASGGCVSVKPSRWSMVTGGVMKSICRVTALSLTVRSCEAGLRGGGLSVHVGALPDDSITVRLEGNVFARNVAGACSLAARLRQWLAEMPVGAATWWQSGCSLCAAALSQRLAGNGTASATCVVPDDASLGGGGAALLFASGSKTAAEAAAASTTSSVSDNQIDGVCSPVVTLRDTIFEQNAAVAFGSQQGRGGGFFVSRTEEFQSLATLTLERVASVGNVAWHGGGGYFLRSARIALTNFSCINCTAVLGDGGGLLAEDTSIRTSQSFVLAHNRAMSGRGGGAALTSCIFGGLQLLGRSADILAAPSASPSATSSASSSGTATGTPSASRTRTASTSVTPTRSVSSSATPSKSISPSASVTRSATATATGIPSASPQFRNAWAPAYDISAVYAALSPGIVMLNNSAAITGGAIALVACNAVVGGAVVIGNSAPEGGGVSVTGSGSLHLCGSLLQMNVAASRSDTAPSGASGYGGALAVVDASKEVHLCNEAACTRYVGLLMRGYDPSLLPLWPFPALLSRLVQSASAAMSKLGVASSSSTWPASPALAAARARMREAGAGAVLPFAPAASDVQSLWTGMAAAAARNSLLLAGNKRTKPGAGDSATCAWAGNAAEGSGGDISVRTTRAAESVASSSQSLAFIGQSLLYSSSATAVGGAIFAQAVPVSLAFLDIASPMAGSIYDTCSTSGSINQTLCNVSASSIDGGGVTGGFGGAVGVRETTYLEIVGVRVVGAVARFGAGLSLQPFQFSGAATVATGSAFASGSPSIPVAKPVLVANGQGSWLPSADTQVAGRFGNSAAQVAMVQDGRVLLDGLLIGNSSAATAGIGTFLLGQLPPRSMLSGISPDPVTALPTLSVDGKLLPAAGGQLPRTPSSVPAASVPTRLELLRTLPLVQGAVPLVSLVSAPAPVATLRLMDAFNATVEWDDSTGCIASVISSNGAALALVYPSLYTASAGLISIQPFAVSSAPGSSGMLRLVCTVTVGALSYELRADIVPVMTASVHLQLDAVAAAPPAQIAPILSPFCNKSAAGGSYSYDIVRPSPGATIARPFLLPVVTGARAWPPDWHVRLTLTDANGLPIAPPAAIPCTLAVESAVDASSRSPVAVSLAAVGAETSTSLLMSTATSTVPVGVSGAADAMINITASCRWVSGESVAAVGPLTVQIARIKLAWVLGELSTQDGNSSACCSDWNPACGSGLKFGSAADSRSSCPLHFSGLAADRSSPAAAAVLGSWSVRPAWQLNLTTTSSAARPVPQVLGVEVFEQGAAAASRILLVAAAPDSSTSASSIMPLLDPPQWAAVWSRDDVAGLAPGALPSSLDGAQMLPLLPAPQLVLLAVHPHASSPLLLGFSAVSGICTASLGPFTSGVALPAQAAAVGRTKVTMVDGVVQFSGIGVTGLPLGSSMAGRLSIDCMLGGGEVKLTMSLPLRVRALQSTLTAPLPAFVPLSSASTLVALKSPLVYALTVAPASTADGSGSGDGSETSSRNVSSALEDASLASELRAISASVVCALSCVTVGGQPCTLQGRTSAAVDYSVPLPGAPDRHAAAATATFDGLGFSELARFPNETCVAASCTWLDGQRVLLPTACTALPRPAVHWCPANVSVGACATEPIAVLAASTGPALPATIAINEPLPSFSVSLRTFPADALASLGLDPAAGSLRCGLSAAAFNGAGSSAVALGSMQLRGAADVVVDPAVGIATFVGVAIQPTAAQSAAQAAAGRILASLSVACFMNAQPFGVSAPYTLTLPQLRATWQVPPPSAVLPATATLAAPLAPIVTISLSDALNPAFVVTAAGSCSVSIVARWLPPDSIASGAGAKASSINTTLLAPASSLAFALLTGAAQRPLVDGVAVFPDLAIAASMGASLTLRAACTRSEGGDVAVSDWNVSVAHAAVAWLAPADPPPLLLTGRPLVVAFAVSWRAFSVADAILERPWRWSDAPTSSSRASPVPIGFAVPPSLVNSSVTSAVFCSLVLDDVSLTPASRPSDVVQYAATAVFDGSATGSAAALVNVTIDITGAAKRMASFQPSCTVGGHTFRAPARQARLAEVSVVQVVPLPSVWLASDSSAVTPFEPAPMLVLAAEDGLPLATLGVTCTVSPLGSWGPGAATLPLFASIMNRTLQSAAAGAAATGSANSSVTAASGLLTPSDRNALLSELPSAAARWPPAMEFSLLNAPTGGFINSLSAAVDAPISLSGLAVRAGFGDWVALSVDCTRPPNKEPTLPLTAVMRVARINAAWLLQPPGESSPGGVFNASLLLYDDSVAQPSSVARQIGASGGLAFSANTGADVLSNDDVTVCTLIATALTDIDGPLDVGAVVLQGGSGRARAGVVHLPSVALTARVGTVVSGRVECATGALVAPAVVLTWRVAISPCPPGSAPAGNGASCVNCGRAYSDGGAGATACKGCPNVGAACSGGVLSLLPGFYRADANPTIDASTELFPCWFPAGCWVNATTTNRSATATHGCNEGFTGVLCGVCAPGFARTGSNCGRCPPDSLNWLVVFTLPAAFLAFGFWAASRQLKEASPFAPLMRIVLGHVQLLGGSVFVVHSTALVRDILQVAEVAGASPLAVAPIQCALGWNFFARFLATLAVAPFLMLATLGAQALLAVLAKCRRKRGGTGGGIAGSAPGLQAAPAGASTSVALTANPMLAPVKPGQTQKESTATGSGSALDAASAAQLQRGCGVKRLLNSPRVVGPAVFVMVRRRPQRPRPMHDCHRAVRARGCPPSC